MLCCYVCMQVYCKTNVVIFDENSECNVIIPHSTLLRESRFLREWGKIKAGTTPLPASFLHIKHRGEEEPLRCGQVQSTLISIPQCVCSESELSQLCHWQPAYATWPWQTYRHPLLNGASEKVWSLFSYEVNFGVSAMLKGNCKTRPDLTEYVPRLNFRVKEKVFSILGLNT